MHCIYQYQLWRLDARNSLQLKQRIQYEQVLRLWQLQRVGGGVGVWKFGAGKLKANQSEISAQSDNSPQKSRKRGPHPRPKNRKDPKSRSRGVIWSWKPCIITAGSRARIHIIRQKTRPNQAKLRLHRLHQHRKPPNSPLPLRLKHVRIGPSQQYRDTCSHGTAIFGLLRWLTY